MEDLREKAGALLETFFYATDLGAVCFDRQLEMLACVPQKRLFRDMLCLGLEKLTAFLMRGYASDKKENAYVFYLQGNLACGVIFLKGSGSGSGPAGAVVTQPFFVGGVTAAEQEAVWKSLCAESGKGREPRHSAETAEPSGIREVLQRLPSVSGSRAQSVCRVLSALLHSFSVEGKIPVTMADSAGTVQKPLERQGENLPAASPRRTASTDISPLTAEEYRHFAEDIRSGDTQTVMKDFSAWQDRLAAYVSEMHDLSRWLMLLCAAGAGAAVEGGAPYARTMELAGMLFAGMSEADTTPAILRRAQDTLLALARTVAVSRMTSYSKPVRQTLEYIEVHYAEKITLESLARQAGLSPPYLSHLVRRETGRILSDHLSAVRVEQSKRLLLETNCSSLEVARRVGFQYQNHFAATFRRETGLSPTEFRSAARFRENRHENGEPFPDAFFSPAIEQLRSLLLFFPGLYDAVRIVDPLSHKAWMLYASGCKAVNGTCYEYWEQKQACGHCISSLAYLHNRVTFKLAQAPGGQCLAIAAPKVFGNSTYVVELLKNVSGAMYAEGVPGAEAPEQPSKFPAEPGRSGLYSRNYIDRELPELVRGCHLEKKRLSILLSLVNDSDAEDDTGGWVVSDTVLRRQADIVNRTIRQSDWAGRYTGNVLLVVLPGADAEAAEGIAGRIQEKLQSYLAGYRKKGPSLAANYGVATLNADISDADMLVRLASMDLYGQMGSAPSGAR